MSRSRQQPPQRHIATGVRLIERAISAGGAPVIGLHLYIAAGWLRRSMDRSGAFAAIKPASIGVPALLKAHPGLSQTELADLMGIERMTAGAQVARCIRRGLVRRERAVADRRKYRLFVTPKGLTTLRRIAALIPLHEQHLFGRLSHRERTALYRVLRKLIAESSGAPKKL